MRFYEKSSVPKVAHPKKVRVSEDKRQGLRLHDEVGRSGIFTNLGASGTLYVTVYDSENKGSEEIEVPPFYELVFDDDTIHSLALRADTDDTNYMVLIQGAPICGYNQASC